VVVSFYRDLFTTQEEIDVGVVLQFVDSVRNRMLVSLRGGGGELGN
jgi:hypothetical protein